MMLLTSGMMEYLKLDTSSLERNNQCKIQMLLLDICWLSIVKECENIRSKVFVGNR